MKTFDMNRRLHVKGFPKIQQLKLKTVAAYCTELHYSMFIFTSFFYLTVLNYYCNGAKGHSKIFKEI